MTGSNAESEVRRWHWVAAVTAAVAVGVLIRLADPLSTPVIPAEDPYKHLALVQEHVRDGSLDPLHESGSMYPPGMHALLGTVWVFSGLDPYAIFRFAPAVLGGVGVLGVALLLARFEGKVAAVFGAFATALAPEVVTRTTMMAPTALDLALLPFLFHALLNVVQGRLAWTAAAVPLAGLLIVSHPWVFGLLALAGAGFLIWALVLPWPRDRGPRPRPRGLAAAGAIVAGGSGLTLLGCWGACGPGFGFLVGGGLSAALTPLAYVLLAGSLLAAALLVAAPGKVEALVPEVRDRDPPRGVLAGLLLVALAAVTYPAVQQGMPPHVALPEMFGWPLLVAAGLGLVALPFLSGPAAHLGAGIAATSYPLVVYNPLDSPFWSHRTAVYLGLGLVLLASVALARPIRGLARRLDERAPEPGTRSRSLAALAPLLLVGASVGGVYASTPEAAGNRWYRLYNDCEMDGLREVSDVAEADPSTLVVAGDWRPKLVLAALTPNASRVWFMETLFTMNETERRDFLGWATRGNRSVVALVDRHLIQHHPDADPSFLENGSWERIESRTCNPSADPPRSIEAYRLDEVKR